MGTYAEQRTLAMLNALKRIDECSRNKEFKARLQAYCDFTDVHERLLGKFKDRGIGLNPEPGTFIEGVSVGHDDAYEPILSHTDNYRKKLIKMMGLSFLHNPAYSVIDNIFYRYGTGQHTFEYFIEELKNWVWIQNQSYARNCPTLMADNLAIISLLPKQVLNDFKSNFLPQEKEDATDHPRLILKKSIEIELSAKTI